MKTVDANTHSLAHLSDHLEVLLLDPVLLSRADVEIILPDGGDEPGGAVVPAHSCFPAARSPFLYNHITSLPAGGKQRLELSDLVPGGGYIGRDALVAVRGYMYTGRFDVPPQKCVDDGCWHGACRPAIDFVVESMYAASGFQISALISLCQRRLSEFVDMDLLGENIIPIIRVASTCQLSSLLDKCVQRFATSTLNKYLGKQLPDDIYSKIKDLCGCPFVDEASGNDNSIVTDRARTVRNIHEALYSDNVDPVPRLLKESAVTLDDAFAVHYAAAYCRPEVLAELLKLDPVNLNLKDCCGYTPLHIACMRQEPNIIVSLLLSGASVLESTPDGRDSLTICKRLTRKKGYNKKLEKGRESRNAHLCIDILEQELERELIILHSICKEETTVTHLLDTLAHLELRVKCAKFMFPSEAMLAMRVAEADSIEDFTKTSARKRKEVSPNENITLQNNRLRLLKTVEVGRRYFPDRSKVLDEFFKSGTDRQYLSCLVSLGNTIELGRRYFPNSSKVLDEFLESCIAEDRQRQIKRTRNEQKDKAAAAPIASTGSSSSTSRLEMVTPGGSPSQAVGATTGSPNTPALPFGLCSQAPRTAGTSACQLESQGRHDVVEDNRFCVGSKTKLKSTVWNEIERVNDSTGKCSWCSKLLSAFTKNGTTHLQRHLNSCQPRKAARGNGGI